MDILDIFIIVMLKVFISILLACLCPNVDDINEIETYDPEEDLISDKTQKSLDKFMDENEPKP